MSKKIYAYGKQCLSFDDYWAVFKALRSDFLTCGPQISLFEEELCKYTGAKYCVVVSSGTAALHLAMLALGIRSGDEVITTPMTFMATSNSALYVGATPRFVDIESDTANINPDLIESAINGHTKVIAPVHFAGQSCDMEKISQLAKKYNLFVVEDAAHAIGSEYKGVKVGSCEYSDLTTFSFHPVKSITTGEGGAITTNNEELYRKLLALRAHGIYRNEGEKKGWLHEMRDLGFNYRLSDIHAALGRSQLKKLEKFKQRRREIVEYYNENLDFPHLVERDFSDACFHLYPLLLSNRDDFYIKAKKYGLHLQVHYIPVNTQPYYQALGFSASECPNALEYYKRAISLPLYPSLKNSDLKYIVSVVRELAEK